MTVRLRVEALAVWRLALAAVLLLAAAGSSAAERILSFDSDIEVHHDGTMSVTETIRVIAARDQIRRGIYRDFPTRYTTPDGDDYVVDFELVQVERDSGPEPHHTESTGDGIRVYIGHKDVLLNPGEYTYRLSYRTDRQLGFFESHDELYWNVTGNGWAFPIDHASARISLPSGIPADQVSMEAYTGALGARGQDYRGAVDSSGLTTVATTRGLGPREGLTVVVTWPKGFIAEPTTSDRAAYFLRDNRIAVIGLVGLGVLLSYYLLVWLRVGRDPEAGTIVPLFHPPGKLSPAAMRYVYRMGFDNKAYAAAIINMAVKGYLTIDDHKKSYRVTRVDGVNESVLSKGETKVARALFGRARSVEFERENNKRIRKSVKALKTVLSNEYHSVQFKTNGWYLLPGVALSVLVLVITGFSHSGEAALTLLFMSLWLTGWSFAVFMLIRQQQVLMAIIFGLFEIMALTMVFQVGSWAFSVLLIALIVFNLLFFYLLKAPTDAGRKLLDKIEGFRLYMATAEENRLNALNPPEQTPELFEKFLPYALALGVDQAWSERFAAKLARETLAGEQKQYRPGWYTGRRWRSFDTAGFSSGLGSSLSTAVARSSVRPGSSSGSGGGGFSGGGGGGGGGGGW